MPSSHDRASFYNACLIAAIYSAIGIAWIYFSDQLVAALVVRGADLTTLQTYKGVLYVLTTGLLLFALSYRFLHARDLAYRARLALQVQALQSYEETIRAFVTMIEARDSYTAGHTSRVARYCEAIARQMGFSNEEIEQLVQAATLHDIGKIQTPDTILLKPGPLSALEYDIVKEHLNTGYETLHNIAHYRTIAKLMRYHHERYDGSGYPQGLHGDAIPLLSHIMIVADAFDAMTSNRVYRPKKTLEAALAELQAESGKQFHPLIVPHALAALPSVFRPDTSQNFPHTPHEVERMAYFYKDQLTGCYNIDYLKLALTYDRFPSSAITLLRLRGLERLNTEVSWHAGDEALKAFGRSLLACSRCGNVYRLYSNLFVGFSDRESPDSYTALTIDPRMTLDRYTTDIERLRLFVAHEISFDDLAAPASA